MSLNTHAPALPTTETHRHAAVGGVIRSRRCTCRRASGEADATMTQGNCCVLGVYLSMLPASTVTGRPVM